MAYKLLVNILLIFPGIKSDVVDILEDVYEDINRVSTQYMQNDEWKRLTQPIDGDTTASSNTHYDFIIVGAGSAGSVLANRLTEVHNWNVLLLEAGKGENLISQVPTLAPVMCFTPYNWKYFAQYQPNMSMGFNHHRMHWPRGKALGGTSVINFMIYTRGNRRDYNRWAAKGNPGWTYDDVLPYFIKSENSKLRIANHEYHGTNGPLSVEDAYHSELVQHFIDAGQELGLPYIDYNANIRSFGVSTIQGTIKKGRRHSAAKAFLHPVRKRRNLHILTSAYVTKVLIDPQTKQTYGVEYERFGKKYKVFVTKEVILSAGTFNSPQLLMLAGIGPKKHLEELDIPVLQDLQVGHNLKDHLSFPGLSFLINKDLPISFSKLLNPISITSFLLNGTGPYTSLGYVTGLGYIKTEVSQEIEDIPDIELIFADGSLSTDYGLIQRRWMNIRDDIYNGLFAPTHNIPTWTILPMLLHPKSTGYLKLRSKDPYDYPLLYGNYFTDPEEQDINTFVAAIRFIQRISSTKTFQHLASQMNPNRIPGCEPYIFDSDDYWKCAIRSISVTLHHQIGTAKMGPPNDTESVVNHELKVHGIGGLRVADCSVISTTIGAHSNAVSIMIGEKASDLIKSNWQTTDNK